MKGVSPEDRSAPTAHPPLEPRPVLRNFPQRLRRGALEKGQLKASGGLLIEGDTCWRRAHAERAAVLIDAASYFEALRASLLAAQRSIIILGWELHSRTRLEGHSRPTDGAPVELGKLLRWLLKRRPQLELRILLWNHPVLYSVHRELFPRWIFGPRMPKRVEIVLDSHLPVGASHHEKLVVIDDEVAYCGGVDLTVRRWDIAAHHPAEPRRKDPARKPYVPQHDVQIVVQGAAAAALAERARTRWEHAGGTPIPPPRGPAGGTASVWPQHVKPDFQDTAIGIMRTVAALEERKEEIREIERATVAAIGSAERFIYIENQYITSKTACEALRACMRSKPHLEALVVTSRDPGGWLEAGTMGVGRQQFMSAFDEPSLARRIQFVAPLARSAGPADEDASKITVDGILAIRVHAKVLIVDDTFLRIGSSNLNNRSMGYDTECDVAIEAENAEQRAAIASVRNRLIAEHWGSDEKSVAAALGAGEPVRAALESLRRVPVFSTAHGARHPRLQPWHRAARAPAYRSIEPIERVETPGIELVVQLGDPEHVVSAEELVAQATGLRDPRPLKWGLALLGTAAVVALLVFGFSRLGFGLADVAERVGVGIESLAASPWRVPLVLVIFVAASLVAVPILALIGATVVTLGPVLGFVTSAVGTLLAASATFGVGRLIGRKPLKRWLGTRLDTLEQRVAKRGIIAIALIRKVPIAPFTFVNMLIGALGIRYRDFILGTALGMLPGIAAFAFVSDRAVDAWREPTPQNIALIATAIVLWLSVVFGIQWMLNRRARQ
jgi:phospholipase D1/2